MDSSSYPQVLAGMDNGALRGWWFGVVVIAVFVIAAFVWRVRDRRAA
ncbi:hypothetical protein ACFYO5_22640 [Streptomyces sp. NPDC006259]